ncbi:MAG: hypothetical protein LBD88_00435 [Candidatus Peribacteria bacterium]|nr:hypothetical protein [Candidatus Peribacteria bacterium]
MIAEIDNTTIAKDFMSLLPITTDLSDYNNTEKIFYSPRKLDTA